MTQPNSQFGKKQEPQQSANGGTGSGLLGRMMWMVLGPVSAIFLIQAIVKSGQWLTMLDLLFAVVVVLMVLGRWLEQRSGAAMTAMGEPAGEKHFTRYVRVLLPLAIGVWLAANVLGIHVLA